MNKYILTVLLLGTCFPFIGHANQKVDAKASAFVAIYQQEMKKLKIPVLALSYVKNLENLGKKSTLLKQRDTLQKLSTQLALLDTEGLSSCTLIDLDLARNDIDVSLQRAGLGIEYLNSPQDSDPEIPKRSLYDLKAGKEWYRYYLHAWLGEALDPDVVFQFGEKELKLAVASYRVVQASLGFKGDDLGLESYLKQSKVFQITDLVEIQSRYEQKQSTVREKLLTQFRSDYGVPHVKIVRSDRGMDFPAPGWYDGSGFVYNMFADSYDLRQMDWLFLHEATPGHHFQLAIGRNQTRCIQELPYRNSAYSEGWAAYVETMGEALGLYRTPEEKLGGIEWNMIRSARVALDVGINFYGWSDEEALAYWHKNVIGKKDIAMREINRMRNWPAQVITYKYGANVFSEMKAYYAEHAEPDSDVRQYHDLALSYGSMLVSTFKTIVARSVGDNPDLN